MRMKPQNLVTGLPVRHLEAVTVELRPRSRRIPVGVVVERRKAREPWIDFLWRPVAVLAGVPDTRAVDEADAMMASARRFMPARPRSSCIAPRPRNYRDNLATGAPSLWVVLRPTERRSALRARSR